MSKVYCRIKDIPTEFAKKLIGCPQVQPNLGTDPEFFIAEKNGGKIIASDSVLPDKDHPIIPSQDKDKHKLFFDGIQAEINVPPSNCRELVCGSLRTCLDLAVKTIGSDKQIVIKPSTRVQKNILMNAKPEARIFGCKPDFNAYTRSTNAYAIDANTHPFRYAGGHIHIGMSSKYLTCDKPEYDLAMTEEGHIKAVKFFDYLSGPLLVIMDRSPYSKKRRSLYGAAGCFRPTPYGIEYRTPSCWWLKSPAAMSLVFGMVRLAWCLLIVGLDEEFKKQVGYTEEEVRGIIDESDIPEAKKFWKAARPYIAITSRGGFNPLHLGSMCSDDYRYIDMDCNYWYNDFIAEKGIRYVRQRNIGSGLFTHALAAFEYMILHGSEILITDDISNEWNLTSRDKFIGANGFVSQTFEKIRLSNEAVKSDFERFQTDFLKVVL